MVLSWTSEDANALNVQFLDSVVQRRYLVLIGYAIQKLLLRTGEGEFQ